MLKSKSLPKGFVEWLSGLIAASVFAGTSWSERCLYLALSLPAAYVLARMATPSLRWLQAAGERHPRRRKILMLVFVASAPIVLGAIYFLLPT